MNFVIQNIKRIAELCDQRKIPYNYAPDVDPEYLVLWPGEENEYAVSRATRIGDIPNAVFHELHTFREAQIIVVEYLVGVDISTRFMVFPLDDMAYEEDEVYVETLHRLLGHTNFVVRKVWR